MAKRPQRPGKKYDPVRQYLASASVDRVTVAFGAVEAILGDALPPSAWVSRTWWRTTFPSTQSDGWQQGRWRVMAVDLKAQTVTFVRQSPETPA
jgi:hypothetical protein